jgi:hypothetical protein
MWPASEASGAISNSVFFLKHFDGLPDPRQRGKIISCRGAAAISARAETFVDIARFGGKKIDGLRRFPPFRDGTCSHAGLLMAFEMVKARQGKARQGKARQGKARQGKGQLWLAWDIVPLVGKTWSRSSKTRMAAAKQLQSMTAPLAASLSAACSLPTRRQRTRCLPLATVTTRLKL